MKKNKGYVTDALRSEKRCYFTFGENFCGSNYQIDFRIWWIEGVIKRSLIPARLLELFWVHLRTSSCNNITAFTKRLNCLWFWDKNPQTKGNQAKILGLECSKAIHGIKSLVGQNTNIQITQGFLGMLDFDRDAKVNYIFNFLYETFAKLWSYTLIQINIFSSVAFCLVSMETVNNYCKAMDWNNISMVTLQSSGLYESVFSLLCFILTFI